MMDTKKLEMDLLLGEEIKLVAGYKGRYSVTSYGRIYSHINSGLGGWQGNRFRVLSKNSHGYYAMYLCVDGTKKSLKVHRLVAEAFIPNPHNKTDVNHIDKDKTNNSVSNLEWVTKRENSIHFHSNNKESSKYPGVSIHKASGKWRAQTSKDGKQIHLGYFDNEEEARDSYLEKVKEFV